MKKIIILLLAVGIVCTSCMTVDQAQLLSDITVGVVSGITGEDSLATAIAEGVGNTTVAVINASEIFEPEQEYYIGRSVAANILSLYDVYENDSAHEYLNAICQTLVINSSQPEIFKGYHVQILDSDEINAFATSGGHILITKAMLECAQSEDALAAVIAHEIAHIQLAHGIEAIQASRTADVWTTGIGSAVSITASAFGSSEFKSLVDSFGEGIEDLTQTLVNTGYSKSQEYDADAMALSLMAKTGYSPYAMIDMLELLEANCKDQHSGFVNTHPKPKYRLTEVEEQLENYEYTKISNMRTARFYNMQGYL